MSGRIKPVEIEDARIGFRNFEGREGPYNKAGERSFAVFLPLELADVLAAEGWNVKYPRDNDNKVDPDEPARDPYIQVAVTFDRFPPKVILFSNGVPTRLGEEEVGMLDWAELELVDLELRPYEWSVRGNSGIKAYLKSGYFTLVNNRFSQKYGV